MTGESQKEPEARPDPTVITTENIDKEVAHLKEKLETALALGLGNVETRLTGFGDTQEERMRRMEELFTERDRRYGERFDAQQVAVDAAFAASEKAINAAFVSSEKAVEAAFKSAQEAVTKAEVSIEKRADATYVSLNDLQRQLTNLMPRSEAEQRISAVSEAIHRIEQIGQSTVSREEYTARHTALQDTLANLSSRMDKQEGYSGGAQVDRSLQAIRAQIDANTASIVSGAGAKAGGTEARSSMYALAAFVAVILSIAATVGVLR